MKHLILNSMQCLLCGDVLVSKHRHDFVGCKCGNLSIDGGNNYQRVICNDTETILDKSVYFDTCGNNFEEVRKVFTWKSYGKNFEFKEGKYITLDQMDTEHIEAILDTQWHIKDTYVEELFKLELQYRKEN